MIGGFGLVFGLLFSLWRGWVFGLLIGLFLSIFAVLCLFVGGSVGAVRIGLVRRPPHPKDSIWRPARHGMLYGLLLGAGVGITAFGMTSSLQFGLRESQWFAIARGVTTGLNFWLFCSLINGSYTLIQHYVLRSHFKKSRIVPGDLSDILDMAVGCRLLCLVNSSFMFPHRWLLDYFASTTFKQEGGTTP